MSVHITVCEPVGFMSGEFVRSGEVPFGDFAADPREAGARDGTSDFVSLVALIRASFPGAGLTLLELDPVKRGYAAWHSCNVADPVAVESACLAHCRFQARRRCRAAGMEDTEEDAATPSPEPNAALMLRFQSRLDGLQYVMAVLLQRRGGRITAEDELTLSEHADSYVRAVEAIKASVQADLHHSYGNGVAESAPWGTIALGATGVACFVNARARQLLSRSAALRIRGGHLEFARAAVARTFDGIFSELSERQGCAADTELPFRALSVPGPQGEPRLALRVAAAGRPRERPGEAVATVCVSDLLERAGVQGPLLAAVFSLSRKEAQLAELLGRGLNLEGAARLMGISRNTARIHLSHIFAKTPAQNQVELARILARLPATPLRPSHGGGPWADSDGGAAGGNAMPLAATWP